MGREGTLRVGVYVTVVYVHGVCACVCIRFAVEIILFTCCVEKIRRRILWPSCTLGARSTGVLHLLESASFTLFVGPVAVSSILPV